MKIRYIERLVLLQAWFFSRVTFSHVTSTTVPWYYGILLFSGLKVSLHTLKFLPIFFLQWILLRYLVNTSGNTVYESILCSYYKMPMAACFWKKRCFFWIVLHVQHGPRIFVKSLWLHHWELPHQGKCIIYTAPDI